MDLAMIIMVAAMSILVILAIVYTSYVEVRERKRRELMREFRKIAVENFRKSDGNEREFYRGVLKSVEFVEGKVL